MTLWGGVTVLALLWFARIAWVDFWTLRIANLEVAGLSLLLLAGLAATLGLAAWWTVLAGLMLFALGFGLWSLGLMGGGDAKLFLPIGLLIGWEGLIWFGILLLPAALGTLGALWLGMRMARSGSRLSARLAEIRAVKGVPYAVPLLAAAAGAVALA